MDILTLSSDCCGNRSWLIWPLLLHVPGETCSGKPEEQSKDNSGSVRSSSSQALCAIKDRGLTH